MAEVQTFLAEGGSPNLENRNGWSLLMAAAFCGRSRIVTLLLDAGADIEATNRVGETVLALAAGGGFPKAVKLLLSHGARVDIRPLGQSLAAYMRVARNPSEAINRLLDARLPAVKLD